MPFFDTPEPIFLDVEIGVGNVRITASERADTSVEVGPTDPTRETHVAAVQQTRVEYADGRLTVKGPTGWRQQAFRRGHSLEVEVQLPAGSHVSAEAGVAFFVCSGHLGECRVKTGIGEIRMDRAGATKLRTGAGDIIVERIQGSADLASGSGLIRVASIGESAAIKNSNGDTWVGEAAGDIRLKAANGKIVIDRARDAVSAKTANGEIRLGEVRRGTVSAQTACGKIDIGVGEGVAAWLDLSTDCGRVHNELAAAQSPEPGAEKVEIHAHSSFGDITIRRAAPGDPPEGEKP